MNIQNFQFYSHSFLKIIVYIFEICKITDQIKDIKQKIKSLEMQKLKLQNTLEVESKEESILQSEVDKLR